MRTTTVGIDQAVEKALEHQAHGRLAEAEQLYRGVLATQPNHPEANHNLGVLLLELNRLPEALKLLKTALETEPRDGQLWVSYIDALIHAGEYGQAQAVLDLGKRRGLHNDPVQALQRRIEILERDPFDGTGPGHWDCAAPAANASPSVQSPMEQEEVLQLSKAGRYGEAESLARALTSRAPGDAWGWKALARLLRLQGRFDDALQAARTAVQLSSGDAECHFELAQAFDRLGYAAEAEASTRRALQLDPDMAAAHNELGVMLERTDRLQEAETSYRRALALDPDSTGVMSNLAIALQLQGRLDDAEVLLRRAIGRDPKCAGANVNLALILKDSGRLREAEAHLRHTLERFPAMTEARSALLFLLSYGAAQAPEEWAQEARRYGDAVRRKATAPFDSWKHAEDPERIRVGIMSGDLYEHPVGFFLEGVLEHLSQRKIELIGYPTSARTDHLTRRIQPYLAAWRPLAALSDEQAATLIHDDGLHVLLELSGHTVNNRLPVLAWRPAPVQVSWLGYFATTGVAEVDYFLADEVGVPAEHRAHFTEKVWYLPDTRVCFTPPRRSAPVSPLPALRNRFVTFGCFQNLAKVGTSTLTLWSRVFAAVPDSRLLVQSRQLATAEAQDRFATTLSDAGIARERVVMRGPTNRESYFAAYGEVDLILDTTPYPGGTTTCEALWMGVPTLTLAGDRLISRQGASLMRAAGLPEWVAESQDDFVAKAIAFAADVRALSQLRAGLRSRLRHTALFDAKRFAANLEIALQQMWQQWCTRQRLATA